MSGPEGSSGPNSPLQGEASPGHPSSPATEAAVEDETVIQPVQEARLDVQADSLNKVEDFIAAFKKPLQQPILTSTPKAHITRMEQTRLRSDAELVPKRSARLAAKSKNRLPKPEAQARKVLMKKAGIQVRTKLEGAASFEEFHEAFKLPLSPSTREAMDVLLHGDSLRHSGRAHAA